MTDRGTHVPLLVRWPGRIDAGTICEDLVDLSDFFPMICELSGTKLPEESIHGRSFAPQLFGKSGSPRQWIHRQNADLRQVRNDEYMLDNKDQLRRVVPLWEEPTPKDLKNDLSKEAAARETLQAVFDSFGQ